MAEMGSYLDGIAGDGVLAKLQEHLAHCQTCTVLVDSARKTIRILTDTASFDLPEAVFLQLGQKIMARIREIA
jgi:hypothetical protein